MWARTFCAGALILVLCCSAASAVQTLNSSTGYVQLPSAAVEGADGFEVAAAYVRSEGTNELIRKGALLTRKAEDIVEELAPVLKGLMKTRNRATRDVTEEEQHLCALLSREPKQIDSISRESQLPSSHVLGILLALELKGIVKQTIGKRFYLA